MTRGAARPDHTTRIVKSSEPEKRTHVPLTTMLPPPPPVPAALRVPYARVTAFKTALLRRLLPPLACLGRPPSGAALRSAVAPHKGQVQRLAWTPRGGGGAHTCRLGHRSARATPAASSAGAIPVGCSERRRQPAAAAVHVQDWCTSGGFDRRRCPLLAVTPAGKAQSRPAATGGAAAPQSQSSQ